MFRDCICKIIEMAGLEVLGDHRKFSAFVSDIAIEYPKERDFLTTCDEKYISFFYDAGNDTEKLNKAGVLASNYLIDQKWIDSSWAQQISNEIKQGILLSIHNDSSTPINVRRTEKRLAKHRFVDVDGINTDKIIGEQVIEDTDQVGTDDKQTREPDRANQVESDSKTDEYTNDQDSIFKDDNADIDKNDQAHKSNTMWISLLLIVLIGGLIVSAALSNIDNSSEYGGNTDDGYDGTNYSYEYTEDDLQSAIHNRDVTDTAISINSYGDQDNSYELDEYVLSRFRKLADTTKYSNFTYMNKVLKRLDRWSVKIDLEEILDDAWENKAKAYLKGEWVCRDYSSKDGMVISIKWNDSSGLATIKKTPSGLFSKGSTKWKRIFVVSEKEFEFDDVFGGNDHSADGTINLKNGIIKCKADGDSTTQIWIKKNKIKEKKEVLKEKDFIMDGDNTRRDVYEFWYNSCDGEYIGFSSFPRAGNLTYRSDAIKHFGYGHVIYQSYSKDPFYNMPYSDESFKSLKAAIKRSKYAVVYFDKNNSWYMKMYFSKKNQFIAWIVANRYQYNVK